MLPSRPFAKWEHLKAVLSQQTSIWSERSGENEHFITLRKKTGMSFWHGSSFELGSRVNFLHFLEHIYLGILEQSEAKRKDINYHKLPTVHNILTTGIFWRFHDEAISQLAIVCMEGLTICAVQLMPPYEGIMIWTPYGADKRWKGWNLWNVQSPFIKVVSLNGQV